MPLARLGRGGRRARRPDVVLDLSDEPVLGPAERFALASRALALGVPYEGADFRFDPPVARAGRRPDARGDRHRQARREDRGHRARRPAPRRDAADRRGRDGAGRPARARARSRRADDRGPARALARRPPRGVGPSRDGGRRGGRDGRLPALRRRPGGAVAVVERARRRRPSRAGLGPDLLVLDGSGAALPPVAAGRRLLVVGAQPIEVAAGYLNAYRARISRPRGRDDGRGRRPARRAPRCAAGPRPPGNPRDPRRAAPATARAGRRASASRSSAPRPRAQHGRLAAHLEDAHGARVTHVSGASPTGRRCATSSSRVDAESSSSS